MPRRLDSEKSWSDGEYAKVVGGLVSQHEELAARTQGRTKEKGKMSLSADVGVMSPAEDADDGSATAGADEGRWESSGGGGDEEAAAALLSEEGEAKGAPAGPIALRRSAAMREAATRPAAWGLGGRVTREEHWAWKVPSRYWMTSAAG